MGEIAVVMIVLASVMAAAIGLGLPLSMALQGIRRNARERRSA